MTQPEFTGIGITHQMWQGSKSFKKNFSSACEAQILSIGPSFLTHFVDDPPQLTSIELVPFVFEGKKGNPQSSHNPCEDL